MTSDRPIKARLLLFLQHWTCYLFFVFLPVDLLYRIDSFRLSMSAWDVFANTALLILFLFVLALAISLLVAPCSIAFTCIIKKNYPLSSNSAPIVTHYLLLLLCSYSFTTLLKQWVSKFGYEITVRSAFVAIVIALLVYWKNRNGFHEDVNRLVEKTWVFAPVMILISIFVVVAQTIMHVRADRTENITINHGIETNKASTNVKPNVILITFDALSIDNMSLYGYHRKTTPNIDTFAANGLVFNNFYASSNWSLSSLASLFTGVTPEKHKLNNINLFNYDPGTLNNNYIKYLKLNGYMTYAAAGGFSYAHPTATGLERYFDIINDLDCNNLPLYEAILANCSKRFQFFAKHCHLIIGRWIGMIIAERSPLLARLPFTNTSVTGVPYSPERLTEQALNIITRNNKQPFFLWIHYYQPHHPYVTNNKYRGTFIKDGVALDQISMDKYQNISYQDSEQPKIDALRLRYDETIRYIDDIFGYFMQKLKQTDNYNNTIIMLSADHGESFKNNFVGHNYDCLNSSVIRVPLIIATPSQVHKTEMSSGSHIDLFPTLLDMLKLSQPDWAMGQSLLQRKEELPSRAVFSMNLDGNPIKGRIRKGHISVVLNNYKLVYNVSSETGRLYNITQDYDEKRDLSLDLPGKKQELTMLVKRKLQL